jgi:peptidoglycan/LPS O-acetylase OafA/YrhL
MWPRYCEVLLALWLIASGSVLDNSDPAQYRLVSVVAGILILILDLLSITLYKRYAYLLVLAVAFALLAFSFLLAPAEAQGTQNLVIVALLLMIFGVLPTEATQPPLSWRKLNREL